MQIEEINAQSTFGDTRITNFSNYLSVAAKPSKIGSRNLKLTAKCVDIFVVFFLIEDMFVCFFPLKQRFFLPTEAY